MSWQRLATKAESMFYKDSSFVFFVNVIPEYNVVRSGKCIFENSTSIMYVLYVYSQTKIYSNTFNISHIFTVYLL